MIVVSACLGILEWNSAGLWIQGEELMKGSGTGDPFLRAGKFRLDIRRGVLQNQEGNPPVPVRFPILNNPRRKANYCNPRREFPLPAKSRIQATFTAFDLAMSGARTYPPGV